MDATPIEEMMGLVDARNGDEGVRALSRDAQKALIPMLRPLVEGAMRLFGTTPPTCGVAFKWMPRAERSGEVEVCFVDRRDVPFHAFVSFASTFELILELCGKTGTVAPPESIEKGKSARFAITWR